ncbi:hypothetical protein C4E22_06610 [ANME-1 cluster archaeon AG-394-G06]|nr:hypothetical protein [ANME-1 cluster archaeon AG-394-G06]
MRKYMLPIMDYVVTDHGSRITDHAQNFQHECFIYINNIVVTHVNKSYNLRSTQRNFSEELEKRQLEKAAMWYAKYCCIMNGKLVEKLLGLVAKLVETSGVRVFRSGYKNEELNIINHTSQIMHYRSHITDYALPITHYPRRG